MNLLEMKHDVVFIHIKHKRASEQKTTGAFLRFHRKQAIRTHCPGNKRGKLHLLPPVKHKINKAESTKKRTVYSYSEEETMLLRLVGYLMYEYDEIFSPNLYSFRKKATLKNAVLSSIKKRAPFALPRRALHIRALSI